METASSSLHRRKNQRKLKRVYTALPVRFHWVPRGQGNCEGGKEDDELDGHEQVKRKQFFVCAHERFIEFNIMNFLFRTDYGLTNKYSVRDVTLDDIPAIRNLALGKDFSVGLHNYVTFYQSSPVGWQVAEDDSGTIVAYYIYNQLPVSNIRFGYQLLVSPRHMGQGITNMFNMPKKDGAPVVLNATPATIQRYHIDGWYDKVLSYAGFLTPRRVFPLQPSVTDVTMNIHEVTDAVLEKIYNYDRVLIGFDRQRFLRRWLRQDNRFGRSVCAVKDNTVRGYGTLKSGDNYSMIAPLYADDDQVALALFHELLHDFDSCLTLSLFFPASNAFMCRFVKKLGFHMLESNVRVAMGNCDAVINNLQMQRVYALHEFWPL